MYMELPGSNLARIVKLAFLAFVIGFILIMSYHARLLIAHRYDCLNWQKRTGNSVYWLSLECYWIRDGVLEPAPIKAPSPSDPRPIDLSGMKSVRYPYGKCTPTSYDYSGNAWPGVCEVTDEEPESFIFKVTPEIGE